MALIYLVQSSSELEGTAGYSHGLLQGGHTRLLVTFAEYNGKNRSTIFQQRKSPARRALSPTTTKKDKP